MLYGVVQYWGDILFAGSRMMTRRYRRVVEKNCLFFSRWPSSREPTGADLDEGGVHIRRVCLT